MGESISARKMASGGVREEPLPHGMTAALEIEFEAFALEDEHGQPPEEH